MRKKEIQARFEGASLVLEPVALDHILLISTVHYERRGAWRPLALGGISITPEGKFLLCRLTDAPIAQIRTHAPDIRITLLGVSGIPLVHRPQGKIVCERNPHDASQYLILAAS
jgi:hypothetical protein